jgi:hypothetical protein
MMLQSKPSAPPQLLLRRIAAAQPQLGCLLLLLASTAPVDFWKLLLLRQLHSCAACLLALSLLLQPDPVSMSAALPRLPLLQQGLLMVLPFMFAAAAADGTAMASPKSPNMAFLPETDTFPGLMSRCTKPCTNQHSPVSKQVKL